MLQGVTELTVDIVNRLAYSLTSDSRECQYTCSLRLCLVSPPLLILIERNPPPPGGFPIYYVLSSRTVSKRTPLEEFVPGASRGVLFLTVLDEGT